MRSNPNQKKEVDVFYSIDVLSGECKGVFLKNEIWRIVKKKQKNAHVLGGTWASTSKGLINLLTKLSLVII